MVVALIVGPVTGYLTVHYEANRRKKATEREKLEACRADVEEALREVDRIQLAIRRVTGEAVLDEQWVGGGHTSTGELVGLGDAAVPKLGHAGRRHPDAELRGALNDLAVAVRGLVTFAGFMSGVQQHGVDHGGAKQLSESLRKNDEVLDHYRQLVEDLLRAYHDGELPYTLHDQGSTD